MLHRSKGVLSGGIAVQFLLLAFACTNQGDAGPRTNVVKAKGSQLISDGAHSRGNAHFFFLPPLVPARIFGGTFDATLTPVVTVCQWAASTCTRIVARFSMTTGTGSEIVRLNPTNQYLVNWHTDQCIAGPCTLSTEGLYRIRVTAGLAELGFADVVLVANGAQAKNVDTDQYIALVDGRTLPIKFRIEVGAVAVFPANGGSVIMGSSGGALAAADTMALSIPVGALATDTEIGVNATTTFPPTTGLVAPVFDLGPEGTVFALPATLTIKEDPALLPPGDAETDLAIATASADTWEEVDGSVLDPSTHTVSAPILHFSKWSVAVRAASVTVTPNSAALTSGVTLPFGSIQLAATVASAGGSVLTGRTIAWTTSDPLIARVDATGFVIGLSPGTATITAQSGSASAAATINVFPPPAITSFLSGAAAITQGSCTTIAAIFAGGSGYVQPYFSYPTYPIGSVPLVICPYSTTTYTLVVTNPAGYSASTSLTVTVLPFAEDCRGNSFTDHGVPGLIGSFSTANDDGSFGWGYLHLSRPEQSVRFTSASCTRFFPLDRRCPTYPLNITFDVYNDGNDWCSFVFRINGGVRIDTGHLNPGHAQFRTAVAAYDSLQIDLFTPGFLGVAGSGGGVAYWSGIPACADDIRVAVRCQ